MPQSDTASLKVCSLEELQRDGVKVVAAEGRTIAVFHDRGAVYALDNRCPHMGFPLHRGTVQGGILTCHWHHARFDLASGCTFDPFADDAARFHTEVRDGFVFLDARPDERDRLRHWLAKLDQGLEHSIPLILAKSVIGLWDLGGTIDVIEKAAQFGIRNRARGWSTGLSILTALANVSTSLDEEDARRALFHGLVRVERATAGNAPAFDLSPLNAAGESREQYTTWFRGFVERRSTDAAEVTLRTAVKAGLPPEALVDIIGAACTDHLYLDTGHSLDFANKAFELLDHIGWSHAADVLSSLIPAITSGERMEETSPWRHPIDIAALLFETYAELDALIDEGARHPITWDGHRALAQTILDAEPAETLAEMRDLIARGVAPTEISAAVAYAAALRAVHFPISNEIADWASVHHSFTYANAVDQALRRSPSKLLARGIFDGAMSVYLERFLNVPKRPIPVPSGRVPSREEFLALFDRHASVEEAGQAAADLAGAGRHDELIRALGHVLLREDSTFHEFQMFEAGLRQHRTFAGRPEGDHVLVGIARFLAATYPTVRALHQTFDIAARLHRGDRIYGECCSDTGECCEVKE